MADGRERLSLFLLYTLCRIRGIREIRGPAAVRGAVPGISCWCSNCAFVGDVHAVLILARRGIGCWVLRAGYCKTESLQDARFGGLEDNWKLASGCSELVFIYKVPPIPIPQSLLFVVSEIWKKKLQEYTIERIHPSINPNLRKEMAEETNSNTSNPKKIPKVLLIGFGGVGTIVSYTLEHLGRAEVVVVARPFSFEQIAERGYRIESCDYGVVESYIPSHVVLTSAEAVAKFGAFDYIVITTKNVPDIAPVVDMLDDCYREGTTVVLIQNGINTEIPIFKRFPKACVISGVTLINTTLYDTTVRHVATDDIKFGPFINYNIDKQYQIDKCKEFFEIYSNPNNKAEYEENVRLTRWRKLVYNSCVNTTCAISNLDSGRVELFGGADTILRPAMKEVMAVAKSEGIELPESLADEMIRGADGVYYPPSMLIDVRNGTYIEHIVIIGNVVKIANENGVSVPTLTVLNNLLKLIQYRLMEANGRFVLPERRPTPEDKFEIKFLD